MPSESQLDLTPSPPVPNPYGGVVQPLNMSVPVSCTPVSSGQTAQLNEALAAASANFRLETRLAGVRLGAASSLFLALRAKHPPTASHCLRVALATSMWCTWKKLPKAQRDLLEIAGLLHDLGKLGVPDYVLQKTGPLSPEERALVDLNSSIGTEILKGSGAAPELLDVINLGTNWKSQKPTPRTHPTVVQLSKMLTIVDAFDSMTSDQVYRRAMSVEKALAELFECSGDQFDPQLVREYAEVVVSAPAELRAEVSNTWLHQLNPDQGAFFWQSSSDRNSAPKAVADLLQGVFHRRLLDSMIEGVIFINHSGLIVEWNRAAERMTGLSQNAVMHKQWGATLVHLQSEEGHEFTQLNCPLQAAVVNGLHTVRRLTIRNRDGRNIEINAQFVPVFDRQRNSCGAVMMFQDASQVARLEERVQNLHEKATRDPLTKVANRAELNRQLPDFATAHLEQQRAGSVIICDIDFFKRINDTFGHQAGDEALIAFASVLQEFSRSDDLVARYGGEEFVILCPDCDITNAIARAEEIRRNVARRSLPSLRGESVTASFGVTQVQAGDTGDTALARADRALLMAKESGRNRVVQLGAAGSIEEEVPAVTSWFSWLRGQPGESLLRREMITSVPMDLAIEKLKGFVSDHKAEVLELARGKLTLRIDARFAPTERRSGDRPATYVLKLEFYEAGIQVGDHHGMSRKTVFDVQVMQNKSRERRKSPIDSQARRLMASLQSYLVAQELDFETKQRIVKDE